MHDTLKVEEPQAATRVKERYALRFGRVDRTLHGFLMFSFLGLALTGMPVLFSDAPWGGTRAAGGVRVAESSILMSSSAQAAAISFWMIFCTFSSKVALVKGLTM